MKTFKVYLGDREWERVHGEQCVGTVQGRDRDDAYNNIRLGHWSSVSHDPTPGYWLVEQP
jgi:hypothetical protein